LKDFMRNNGILILIIAGLLAAIMGVFSFLPGGYANPLSNLWGIITSPVKGAVTGFINWTEGVYDYSFRFEELEAENARLKKQLAEMEQKAIDGEAASKENELLRKALELREKRADFQLELADVLSRSTLNWESLLTINKGQVHDLAAGDCVIDETGALVGVVIEVGVNWSTVRTVIDPDTQLGGLVARTDSPAIAEGDFALMPKQQLKLSYLPENTQLIAGDLILTSGLNGNYPSGLIIGAITELHTEASGMSRYAVIQPRVSLEQLKQVFVIKDFDIVE